MMGGKMKRGIILFFPVIFCGIAFADTIRYGDDNKCFVNVTGKDDFYFCGHQDLECAGRDVSKRRDRFWLYHHESKTVDGKTYWCCHGTRDSAGFFVQANSWTKESETVTIDVGGGICNYTQIVNVCGDDESVVCKEPKDCPKGTQVRNGQCVALCHLQDGNKGFESLLSNNCVECVTSNYQGIDKDGVCVKCNTTTQFWDVVNRKCIDRSELEERIPSDVMQKCWQCPNNDIFKECVTLFVQSKDERVEDKSYNSIIKDCKIDDR